VRPSLSWISSFLWHRGGLPSNACFPIGKVVSVSRRRSLDSAQIRLARSPPLKIDSSMPTPQAIQKLGCTIQRLEAADVSSLGLQGAHGQASANHDDECILLCLYRDIHLSANSKHLAQGVTLYEAFVSHRACIVDC
jgi:hypothetical protein